MHQTFPLLILSLSTGNVSAATGSIGLKGEGHYPSQCPAELLQRHHFARHAARGAWALSAVAHPILRHKRVASEPPPPPRNCPPLGADRWSCFSSACILARWAIGCDASKGPPRTPADKPVTWQGRQHYSNTASGKALTSWGVIMSQGDFGNESWQLGTPWINIWKLSTWYPLTHPHRADAVIAATKQWSSSKHPELEFATKTYWEILIDRITDRHDVGQVSQSLKDSFPPKWYGLTPGIPHMLS